MVFYSSLHSCNQTSVKLCHCNAYFNVKLTALLGIAMIRNGMPVMTKHDDSRRLFVFNNKAALIAL